MARLFILLFVSSLLYCCTSKPLEMPVEIDRNDVLITYAKCGKGDTTLLFIHGWCINKEYWQPQVDHFCPRYTVVTVDLPGFGASGKNRSNWSFDEYTEDVKKVIEELKLKHVILIGHSMSGDILLDADNKYPKLIDGIIGIDNLHQPGTVLSEEEKKSTEQFFSMLSSDFDNTVTKYMSGVLFQPTTDSAIVKRVMNDVYKTDSVIATKVLRALSGISQQEQPLMKGLSHKLYLVNSDVNPVSTDSLSKYCAKGFNLETVHATGHYPMIEKPAAFNAALQTTLDKIAKGNL